MAVDGDAAQVLQAGGRPAEGAGEAQLQAAVRALLVGPCGASCQALGRHCVVQHQLHRARESAQPRTRYGQGVKAEGAGRVFDAQVRGAQAGLHRQREQVPWVGAVSKQEGALQRSA